MLFPTVYRPHGPDRDNLLTSSRIRVCPECAGPVSRNCGCASCTVCGWGRCG